jgi:hypothetical protein
LLAAGLSLGSRRVERPSDGGSVLTATLDGAAPAYVDGGGLVTLKGASWSLDWWIGADDRWYLPAREPSVRQRRLGSGPVVETTVRIPSGDARQTVAGAIVGGRPATVVEIHNDSPVPVALAMAVRPYAIGPHSGPASEAGSDSAMGTGLRSIDLDQTLLRLGDGTAVVLPRSPNQSGAAVTHDVLDDLLAGRDLEWVQPADVDQVDHSTANGAVLYPLPHRTSLRFVIVEDAADRDRSKLPTTAAAPDAETVAAGWTSVIDAAATFTYADPGLTQAMAAARARLLLAAPELPALVGALHPTSGPQLAALAVGGHHREVGRVLAALANAFPRRLSAGDDGTGAAAIVGAAALAAELAGTVPEPALLESVLQTVQVIERSAGRRPWRRTPSSQPKPAVATAKRGLARLARLAGDPAGAAQLVAGLGDSAEPAPTSDAADLDAHRAMGSSVGAWGDDDPDAAARFVVAARSLLVNDDSDQLVLLPGFAASWRGGSLDVHRIPTRHGRLSLAVRWHGARPALLWEVEVSGSAASADAAPQLTCPALDPDWSTGEARGETLLAGVAEPLPDSPMPGDSFT